MIICNIGLEAEVFLINKEGEIISPSSKLPLDGSGNIIEIRANPAKSSKDTIENFYRKLEQVKELCFPNFILFSKKEKLSKKVISRKAYSYKGTSYEELSSVIETEQTCGLHIHIEVEFLNEFINFKLNINLLESIIKNLDNELFKIIKFDVTRKLSDYRLKTYNSSTGFEYRSLYFDKVVLKKIPEIVKKVEEIIKNDKEVQLYFITKMCRTSEDIEKINANELFSYIEKLDSE